ncbi:helix-turn-helix domain-containing protein [Schumannella luteola]
MRESFYEQLRDDAGDDLLTTGEAARILGVSRQHVVDLCDRGELPYLTVGTHRRIRRSDLLLAQQRTNKLTRDQRRSLWLAYAIAGRIVHDPQVARAVAERNLRQHEASGRTRRWTDEWRKLLDGPLDRLLVVLTSEAPISRELRQNSPFAGLLSDAEREAVLSSFAWEHGGASRAKE